MTISTNGLNIIKQFEGCVLKVYRDPVGIKTVGYGHTGADVNAMAVGTPVTQAQADAWLRHDVTSAERNVSSFDAKYHWSQNQYDALVSFAFNVGSINQLTTNGTRTIGQISQKILAYNRAGGAVLAGLTRRRKAEKELFDKKATVSQTATNTAPSTATGYAVGTTYALTVDLYVRSTANGAKVTYSALTANAKKNGYADSWGHAILKTGTKVTCKAIKDVNGATWMQIPSGWICAKLNEKIYVK